MKETHRAFTSKAMLLLAASMLSLSVQGLQAQTRYDKVQDISLWDEGRNVSFLRTDSAARVSYAQAQGTVESGDFKAPSDASSLWKAGAEAKTRTDLRNFSMLGSFSFSQKHGKDMCGSMFTNPGYYPIDILEFTPGEKTLQTYSFTGGIAAPLGGRWTAGVRIDFESSNYSKTKDIRHTNYALDMTFAPSITFSLGEGWTLGASGLFRKTSESVQAEQIGTATASSYYAFLDKGSMYGSYQVWDGSGIHLKDTGVDRFAIRELSYGAAFQIQKNLESGRVYADCEYLLTQGEQGEKSYNYYSFPGAALNAHEGLRMDRECGSHLIKASLSWKEQENYEKVIDKETSGGVTTPVTYGSNRIFDRRILSLAPEYSFYGSGSLSWLYKAHAEAGWSKRKELSTLVYPYSNLEDISMFSAAAGAVFQVRAFRIGGSVSFMTGTGKSVESSQDMGDNIQVSSPYRLEDWYDLEKEWKTASRIGGSLSLRYDFQSRKIKGMFMELDGTLLHGFEINLANGAERLSGLIRVGYEF